MSDPPGTPLTQAALDFGPVLDVAVHLRCPACGYGWHAATLTPGAWWMEGSVEKMKARTSKECYCPNCHHRPPMEVAA